ncbi:PepSY domain-containing protein [Pseudomonas aeruginosa]|nr:MULTISPECIES: PepSY domain-containing protein [Pseudomonas]ALZ24033.1 hypothetical protein HV96_04595 [Pseudomonas aeruginosa]AOT36529.1 hypothetical protein BHE76_04265 [Pseudomonas aeruginosa]AUA85097.1 PepSY domain-containing protein [Pseudomonas aeruginosa]AUA91188.1 PepSY domain-containing protein [Pseudomonas aeruginosa]AXC22377.1 PepSY domain-containing protein [Pseudomonas aeruginosa]
MNLRQSMSGLHTWSGLLVSWLLFVIVFAGSLASFDKELTRWMQPDLHLPGAQSLGADQVRDWLRQRAPDAHAWWVLPPSERAPYWNAGWEPRDGSEFKVFQLDAVSGQPLPKTVGGEFFFTLHYDLHAGMVGLYIVGIAGMLMLVALVSGTIVHRRIFKDFFTLRPQAARQRAWLDAHNVLGVIGLPFHLMIAYTGLVIFIVYYMQAGLQVVYQNDGERFFHEVQGSYEREEVGRPAGPPASIGGLIVEAGKVWGDGGAPGWISVHHPYDEAATVDIRRRDASRILDDQRTVNFDASSGELLHAQPSYAPGYATYGWLTGLHMIQWGGQLVRWMYLLLGLSGAMMIFGGLQVWLAKREVRGSRGVGLVRALNLAVCGGLPLASLALLWGNRLLPTQLAGRDTWEIRVFCASWALVALWAIVRRNSGTLGRTQLRLAAVLALGLPLLGLLRSPEGNLLASLQRGDWVLAGVDLSLLGLGLLCAWLGWRRRQASSKPARRRLNVEEVA